ncbi:MAG: hypothetical protein LUF90_05820 [Rikenellaceae bacterium]|nr:hypothetical protein [Rikenellaceae bacterium]
MIYVGTGLTNTLDIITGGGFYTAESDNETVATAEIINGTQVQVTGNTAGGSAAVTITDRFGQTASFMVEIY